jgi:hypothetical protein
MSRGIADDSAMKNDPATNRQFAALEQRVASAKAATAAAQRSFDQARELLLQAKDLEAAAISNLSTARRHIQKRAIGDIDFSNITTRSL